ncbi:Hypothetical predicted protein [Podarcis lilfordi]|uniref:Uncharacterized protein n=1 Tax=Podarcis lilfordi TaxID=74358 RepID=A0AA35LNA1_9SAUR|nr:Hypothetical predicted protein [Podarcis lilfordi]
MPLFPEKQISLLTAFDAQNVLSKSQRRILALRTKPLFRVPNALAPRSSASEDELAACAVPEESNPAFIRLASSSPPSPPPSLSPDKSMSLAMRPQLAARDDFASARRRSPRYFAL